MTDDALADALAVARDRYTRFHAGDLDAVRGPEVAELARRILALSTTTTPDGPALVIPGLQGAALVYWARCVAAEQRGQAPDRADETALWTLIDTLHDADPALVPFPVPTRRPVDPWQVFAAGRQVLTEATAGHPFDPAGVRRAAELLRQAMTLAEGTPDHAEMLGSFGATMIDAYQCGGEPADIEAAVTALRGALAALPAEHVMHTNLLATLAGALVRRFDHSADLADLAEAEELLRTALPRYSASEDPTPAYADLASALNARANRTDDLADVAAAIRAGRDAVAALPAQHPSYPGFALELGRQLSSRYRLTGEPSDVDEMVDALRRGLAPAVVAARRDSEPALLATDLLALCAALMCRVDESDEVTDDLQECVEIARTAVEILPDNPFPLATLGVALRTRWARLAAELDRETARFGRGRHHDQPVARSDGAADLNAALAVLTEAAALGARASVVTELGVTWKFRYDTSHDLADLDRAIDALGVLDGPDGADGHEPAVVTYGHALLERFDRVGDRADLDASVEVLARAARRTGAPAAVLGHAAACSTRFQHGHDPADIDTAIEEFRRTLPALDDRERGRAGWRLGVAYWQRYTVFADLADANRAVDTLREALDALAFDDQERPSAVIALGNTLADRGQRLGSSTDVVEAARCFQSAVRTIPPGAERDAALVGLGKALSQLALSQLALSSLRADHFDRAEAAFRELLAGAVTARLRDDATVGLGTVLSIRGGFSGNAAELDEGIALLAATRRPGDLAAPLNLANALKLRYGQRHQPADLDQAIAALDTALPDATPPARAVIALHQADLWSLRDQPGDHDRAYRAYLEVADGDAILASYRVFAAQSAGRLAASADRWDDALSAYTTAIELLPLIVWRGLDRADQQRYLADFAGLAGEAAAVALSAGRPRTAVEVLEHGRAVLWTQVLQTRGDPAYGSLTELARDRPDLAEQLTGVRAALRAPATALPGLPAEIAAAHTRIVHAHREQELIAQVRAQPGQGNFLRRKGFDELRTAASAGPVVLVNLTARRCDALVVTAAEPLVVELPVTATDVLDRARTLVSLRPGDGLAAFVDAQSSLVDILGWLWDTVVGPVLAAIPDATRVWWCPAGLATLFPLHAAGHYATAERTSALDRVVSSYTTTLTTLTRARQRPGTTGGGQLVVGVADAPNHPHLSQVDEEVLAVAGDTATTLVGPAATADRVLAELAGHPWAHFAGHGHQDVADPSGSHLAMHDRPLTVLEIAALELPDAELAFLSACETAASDGMPDEAISTAAALQLAGYRNVIATLWPIPDRSAVAEAVYRPTGGAPVPPADPALALHEAVRSVLAANPYEPTAWAPYQHLGP